MSGVHPGARAAEWTRRSERGSILLIRFIVWASLRLGRPVTRAILRGVTAYFFLTARKARAASREYLARCLGHAPTLREEFRLLFSFASTIHDRVFFLARRFEAFAIEVHGTELFDAGGALLMGAHLGSFEVLRACAHMGGGREVAMAMYEENAQKVRSVLATLDPTMDADIVALGHIDSMLKLRERLERGALVGFLADRTLGDEPSVTVPFLGAPAPFPTGPMRMAAALRQRVVFMTGLYRGGNRYEVRFEPLADFRTLEGLGRDQRDRLVRDAVTRYAQCLERHCRAAPDNWFNFFPFWTR